ncbi:MAG: hypothetical protein KBC84_02280 [Proteobacteria bacterium]|nr:hypothetical protein [Pseudomonadota bacterium]
MKIKIQFSFLLFSLLFINSAYAIDQDDELFDQVDMQLEQQRAQARAMRQQQEEQKATMKQYEAKMKAANAYNEALQSGFVPGSTTGGFEDSKEAQSQKVFGGGPMGAINKLFGGGGGNVGGEVEQGWSNPSAIKTKPDDSYDYKLREELAKPIPRKPSRFDSNRDRLGDVSNRLNNIKRPTLDDEK